MPIKILDDCAKVLLGLFVQIGDGDASSQDSIIRMLRGEICRSLGREIVKFDSGDPVVDTRNDLFGDSDQRERC